MEQLIDKILANPVADAIFLVAFVISMLMYRRRVKRENSPDYVRPKRMHES
jgi:hypothetical protein